ncbi:MAG: hypothetical protein QW310_03295 [Thermoproteota archaeon]
MLCIDLLIYKTEWPLLFLNKYSNAGNVVALTVGLFVFIVFVATFDRLVWVPILNRIKRFRFGD